VNVVGPIMADCFHSEVDNFVCWNVSFVYESGH